MILKKSAGRCRSQQSFQIPGFAQVLALYGCLLPPFMASSWGWGCFGPLNLS